MRDYIMCGVLAALLFGQAVKTTIDDNHQQRQLNSLRGVVEAQAGVAEAMAYRIATVTHVMKDYDPDVVDARLQEAFTIIESYVMGVANELGERMGNIERYIGAEDI